MASMLFELNQLRAFVAVAEELNFRRGGQRPDLEPRQTGMVIPKLPPPQSCIRCHEPW